MDDELHDLIGAYAMDALDPAERTAFEQHLATCPACQTELVGLSDALAELSADYQVEPPPALRSAVLGAVANLALADTGIKSASSAEASEASTKPVPAEPTRLPRPAAEDTDPKNTDPKKTESDSTDEGSTASVTTLRPRSATPSGRTRWQLLVAAAVALVAVFGISVWQPWVQRTVTAADVLTASDAVRATETVDGNATVTLVRSNQLGKAVLVTQNLANPPSDKVRQAWLQHSDGTMVSGGLMPAGPNVTLLLEGDARNTVGAGISIEPTGGSDHPTLEGAVLIGL